MPYVATLLCLLLSTALQASGDEAADRQAIRETIAALNQWPLRADVFTDDAYSDLGQLPNVV